MEEEEITKNNVEKSRVQTQKDPKKVKAGQASARKNAEARNLKKVDSPTTSTSNTISSIYDDVKTLAGAVGVGITFYQGYQIYKNYRPPTPVEVTNTPTPVEVTNTPTPVEVTNTPTPRKSMEF